MTKFHRKPWSRRSFLAGTGAVAAGISILPKKGWSAEEPKLNFYNWDTYIGEETIPNFEGATGIEVTYDLFADNEELFAKLKGGNPGYDLIVPTNDYAERMILAGILQPLDHSKIPNMKNLDPAFQDADFDPGRKYTLPYMWGTMGIGYRKSAVDGVPDSWKTVFDSDQYSGRIAWISEAGSVLGMAMKYLGYSFNSKDPAEIKAAEELLIKQKQHVKTIAEDNGQDLLLSGEVDLAIEWNGDIQQIIGEDPDIAYVVPNEGSLIWQDTLAIPTGAPHPENAHKMIDFLLGAEEGRDLAEWIEYATPNAAARELTSEEYRNNPAIFPTAETLAACESALYLGEERQRAIEEAWTRINAA